MLAAIRKEWYTLLLAFMFYSRMPVPSIPDQVYSQDLLNRATRYFPFVGLVVATLVSAVMLLFAWLLPGSFLLRVLLGMAFSLFATGAFHEDGLADAFDGFGGGHTKEDVLTIMKDSRLGTYGVLGLLGSLSLKAAMWVFIAQNHGWVALTCIVLAIYTLSRFMALAFMVSTPMATSQGKVKPIAASLSTIDLVVAIVITLLVFGTVLYMLALGVATPNTAMSIGLVAGLVPTSIVLGQFRGYVLRRIGGYTGDVLGTVQQIAELCSYLTTIVLAVVWIRFF